MSLARVVCTWAMVVASVAGVPESSGSNTHFYDRDKHEQSKRFELPSDYFNTNAQVWGQMGQYGVHEAAPSVFGDSGGAASQYFGGSVAFPAPRQEKVSDGTLDSMQYCKCNNGQECEPTAKQPAKSHYACGAGQILCCYDGHPRYQQHRNSDRYLSKDDGSYVTVQNTGNVSDKKWNSLNDPQNSNFYPPSSIPRLPNYQGGINEPSNFESLPPGGMFINGRPRPASGVGTLKSKKFLNNHPVLVRPGGQAGLSGPIDILNGPNNIPGDKGILVGPGGPTGIIGPVKNQNPPPLIIGPGLPQDNPNKRILSGPGGPTGIVGPPNLNYNLTPVSVDGVAGHTLNQDMFIGADGIPHLVNKATYSDEERNTAASAQRGVLVGPGGATGIIGPNGREDRKGLLVGPGGPWGSIGPADYEDTSTSAQQRGVLVGPGGPTGVIGPAGFNNKPVLVGPGGPTGVVGPAGFNNRPVLVGPDGPTGIIGPSGFNNRPVLVGPGGPTGIIGPYRRPSYGNRPLQSGFRPYGYRAQKTVLGPNWLSETSQRGVLVGPGGPTGQIGPPQRK